VSSPGTSTFVDQHIGSTKNFVNEDKEMSGDMKRLILKLQQLMTANKISIRLICQPTHQPTTRPAMLDFVFVTHSFHYSMPSTTFIEQAHFPEITPG